MMVLVLIRGALKGLGSAHKCALSQVRARLEVGEAEPARRRSSSYSESFLVNLARACDRP
jgi:hypothetical protein